MKLHFMLIPMVAGMLFSCQPDTSSFFPQRAPSVEHPLQKKTASR